MHTMYEAEVGGIAVRPFAEIEHCARYILAEAHAERGGFGIAINAEKVINSRHDAALKAVIERASLRYADGAGVVLAMRLKGVRSARVAGADLWLECLRASRGQPIDIALIGAAPAVLRSTRARLESEFPNVNVTIARDGFDGARDVAGITRELHSLQPSLVFVALGSPRQELLIEQLRSEYPRAFYLGLGGSFDIYSGLKKRAPLWMQRHGLEWTYRFLKEPSRARRETKRLQFLLMLASGRL
jgi:UDP-N-acetyl-D-mannosaminouronate:lipid I N-acetyl-D-mannosaminouronosyltransferase